MEVRPASLLPLLASRIAGRGDVLAHLEEALRPPARPCGALELVGEAGIGKSRIARFAAERAAHAGRLVLQGRADPSGQAQPLGVIRDALRDERRSTPGLPVPSDPLAAEFPSLVLPELGAAARPEGLERDALFEAGSRYFRARARGAGLLLVLEDLHWADPTSLELVGYLARTTRDDPLLLVLTHRPEESTPDSPLRDLQRTLRRERLSQEVPLRPLDEVATAEMLADALGRPVSPEAQARLVELAGGNPFWLEELVGAAVEAGQLDPASGDWRGTGPTALPWTVAELATARASRLDAGDRALLDLAALGGERLDLDVLARALGRARAETLAGADRLLAAGLLNEGSSDRFGRTLRFRHTITREALARAQLGARRREGHGALLAAGESLRAEGHDLSAADLARHAVEAGDRARAFDLTREAAAQARALGGVREVERHLQAALELWDPAAGEEARAEVLLELGRVLVRAHHDEDAVACLDEAAAAFRALGDDGRAAIASVLTAELSALRGRRDRARARLAPARHRLAELPPQVRLATGASVARTLMLTEEWEESAAVAQWALDLPPHPDDDQAERISLLITYAGALWLSRVDDPDLAERCRGLLEQAERLAREHRDDVGASRALLNLSVLTVRPDESLVYLARARELLQARGMRVHEPKVVCWMADYEHERGDLDAAERLMADARAVAAGLPPDPIVDAEMLLSDVGIALTRGHVDRAHELLGEELFVAQEHGIRRAALALAARVQMARGEPERASALLAEELADPQAIGDEVWHMTAGLEAAALTGDTQTAARVAAVVERLVPGPVSRYASALAALAAGEGVDAEPFRRAARDLRDGDRRLAAAEMLAGAASVLAARGLEDDAAALAADALEEFRDMALDERSRRLEELLRSLGRRAPTPARRGREGLTARELEVLALLGEGLTNQGIADRLVISPATATRHVANLFAKLGVHSRAHAVRIAAERGLVEPG